MQSTWRINQLIYYLNIYKIKTSPLPGCGSGKGDYFFEKYFYNCGNKAIIPAVLKSPDENAGANKSYIIYSACSFLKERSVGKAPPNPNKVKNIRVQTLINFKMVTIKKNICKKIKKTLAFYITLCYIVFALSA